jgi:hypothetical protein
MLPLKYSTYLKLKNREITEADITINDLAFKHNKDEIRVFYYYSMYAESLDKVFLLLKRLFSYFKKNKFNNYLVAGISYRKTKVELLKQFGLKKIWEVPLPEKDKASAVFMEGDFDTFLSNEPK